MVDTKRSKNILFIGITVITLLEIYFGYTVIKSYKGIYQVQIFIPLILQPFVYKRVLSKELSYFKLRIITLGFISFLLPIMIYFTLPNYTYNSGKDIVKKHLNQEISFKVYSISESSIPVTNNPKQLFVSNKEYYYEITSAENKHYFITVNPLTGELQKLTEAYWK